MDAIEHTTINTNGIKMHIASIGTGPVVLLLHGFPELWYSWRHQLLYLSSVGYRAIAPDLRGYGDTESPESHTSYTVLHIVGDLVGALDELGIEKVFLVGHDWGAIIAWYFCLFRPDRIKALVNLSVQFFPRNPEISFIERFRAVYGDDFYMCRFQVNLNFDWLLTTDLIGFIPGWFWSWFRLISVFILVACSWIYSVIDLFSTTDAHSCSVLVFWCRFDLCTHSHTQLKP